VSSPLENVKEADPDADKEPACAENATKDPANADKPTLVTNLHSQLQIHNLLFLFVQFH
jgi:hypothetical protein